MEMRICISLLHLSPAAADSLELGTSLTTHQVPPQPHFVQGYEIFAFGTLLENRVSIATIR